jgi:dihydrolipoamide dehydrogenase
MKYYDVIVIGGGPGGYSAAVRSSQLGMKTALVEKESIGGTCLNWGCIPAKALLRNAEVIHLLSMGRAFGFTLENLSVDYGVAHKRSRMAVKRQTRRIDALIKKNGIALFSGRAKILNAEEIEIEASGETLKGKHIIIATGAKARQLPGTSFDGERIISYRKALDLVEIPSSAVIIGAGAIGMEFATLWSRYGSDVTVLEAMPYVLPLEDSDVSIEAERQFKRNGIKIIKDARIQSVISMNEGVEVTLAAKEGLETLKGDVVLVAIGFEPNSRNLGLKKIGVATTCHNIDIDDHMGTTVPNIYAIGDVTGKLGLAHVASAQGIIAAEAIAGLKTRRLDYTNIPRCTYTSPEVASVGLSEQKAKEQGFEVVSAQCPFVANGKALALDENFGFAKVVSDKKSRKILGVHLIGAHVTELVAGPAGMIAIESRIEDLGQTVHPHPTLSETIMEAAQAICGYAIHI